MSDIKEKVICGLYTRVSTQQQLESNYTSLESQREILEAYCNRKDNFNIYKVYKDGGYSGGTLERPALQEMIRDITAKKINCVVVYKLDRLIRSLREFYTLNDLFIEYKVHFVCTDFNIDTSTAVGNLGLNMLLSVAQFERDIASDRIRDKLQQRAQKGMWHGGTLPYGYGNVDKKLIINHQEAERLRFIYQMYAQNPSVSHVRQELHLREWYNKKR